MDSHVMFKHRFLVLIALAGAGTVIWLASSYELEQAKPAARDRLQTATEAMRQASHASDEQLAETEIPESKRHAADDIEKHRKAAAAALDQAILDQEAKVEERRKVLATIVRTKGIVYSDKDSSYDQNDTYGDKAERDAMQAESQVSSLLKYDNEQLMIYAAGLDLPDNSIKVLYPQYVETKRRLEEIKGGGIGEVHPTRMAQTELTQELLRQLNDGVVNLRASLQAKLEMAKEEAIKRGRDAQDYVDAKKEFKADEQVLREMKLKRGGK